MQSRAIRLAPGWPGLVTWLLAAVLVVLPSALAAASLTYQGFGASTPGGAGGAIVRVTNLNDSGPGSLRAALAGSRRTIVFDVAGEIVLGDYLYVGGSFVTIDGFSAPAPGITLRDRGLIIRGSRGAHDVIVRGLRVRNSPIDGIQVAYGAYNVVIDHVSIQGSGDGDLDITESSHDVTVSWSILAEPASGKTMLIKYNPSRVTLHHNLFVRGVSRNPNVSIDNDSTPATDTTLDMRNNLVWDWGYGWGTQIHYGSRANVVSNFYASPGSGAGDRRNALLIDRATARAYVSDNVSGDGVDLSRLGTEAAAFPAPPVDTQEACAAAAAVVAGAGLRPLDDIDQKYLARITLPPCATVTPMLAALPGRLDFTATQGGPAPAPGAIALTDVAGNAIGWTASAGSAPWLSVSGTTGTTPASLAVSVDPSGLAPGVLTGAVTVQAPGADNSLIVIPVTLTVSPAPAGLQTVAVSVSEAGGDAGEHVSGKVRTDERALKVGRSYILGFRFTGVPVPQGVQVQSAVLKLYALGAPESSVSLRYAGEATDDSAPLQGSTANLSRRAVTAAAVDDLPGPWRADTFNLSADLTRIVQEIVARPGWAPGRALTLFVADDGSKGSRSIATFDRTRSASLAPVLEITFR